MGPRGSAATRGHRRSLMAQCVGRSQRTGERCKRPANQGSSTCSYHSADPTKRAGGPRSAKGGGEGVARKSGPLALTAKELSARTWGDYEQLFAEGTGWGRCACLFALQVRRPSPRHKTWAQQREANLGVMHGLVEERRSRGILVYDDGAPVGWCQFVPKDELRLKERAAAGAEWFVTCFVVDPRYRGHGVTGFALRAAIEAIKQRGGGIVEGVATAMVPGAPPKAERSDAHAEGDVLFYGGSARVRFRYDIEGVGPVTALYRSQRSMHGAPLGGTMELFRREGFDAVEVLPRPSKKFAEFMPDRIVMRRSV
jgi:GNAT superfamily N-acetyltransferase